MNFDFYILINYLTARRVTLLHYEIINVLFCKIQRDQLFFWYRKNFIAVRLEPG